MYFKRSDKWFEIINKKSNSSFSFAFFFRKCSFYLVDAGCDKQSNDHCDYCNNNGVYELANDVALLSKDFFDCSLNCSIPCKSCNKTECGRDKCSGYF